MRKSFYTKIWTECADDAAAANAAATESFLRLEVGNWSQGSVWATNFFAKCEPGVAALSEGGVKSFWNILVSSTVAT